MKDTDKYSLMNIFGQFSNDPLVESNVLNDMGHVLLDGFTFLSRSSQIRSKIFTILGRISVIASDYIPDHTINPDELFFQLFMLTVAITSLSQDLLLLGTKIYSTSFREKRIYVRFFRDSGLAWNEYKLIFSKAFKWVEIQPFTTILQDSTIGSDFLWVYDGTVEAGLNGSMLKYFERNSVVGLEQIVEEKQLGKETSNIVFRSGEKGASLLKVNLKKISEQMNEDDSLQEFCRTLMCKVVKSKAS